MPRTLLDSQNIPALAARAAQERAGQVGFLIPSTEGSPFRPLTYGAWWGSIARLAIALRASGVRPGDRVLLMMETRYEWVVCDLAILSCGAWTVPLYSNLPPSQLVHPLADSGARFAIVSRPELGSRLLRASGALERITTLFLLDGAMEKAGSVEVRGIRSHIEGNDSPAPSDLETLRSLRDAIRPEDPATILYTSGTSATPKGVVLAHGNILANARAAAVTFDLSPADRYLSFLPLAHTLERTVTYALIGCGVRVAYGHGIESIARDCGLVRPTIFLGVPRLFERILGKARETAALHGRLAARLFRIAERAAIESGRRHGPIPAVASAGLSAGLTAGLSRLRPRAYHFRWQYWFFRSLRERFGGRIRLMVSGSAPLALREAAFFCGAGFPMLEGYGLTEAGPVVSVNRIDAWKLGSVGLPLSGGTVEVRIREDGEILVRGPSVMAGYRNLDAETRTALQDGWLHTGDLGEIDEQGFITITGRKKDLIVTSGGKNISPQPIEDALRGSPLVHEAVVFGDRRPHLVALLVIDRDAVTRAHGEEIVRDPARAADLRALIRAEIHRVTDHLAPHERVRNFDILETPPSIEAGTLTPTLKVRRSVLAAQQAGRIDAMYGRNG
jgi:long-chain acyl-CoA synthetase